VDLRRFSTEKNFSAAEGAAFGGVLLDFLKGSLLVAEDFAPRFKREMSDSAFLMCISF
jgi:hypothetical protein